MQISTEKKVQTYNGIAGDAMRLINFENQRDIAQRFIVNNVTAELRLKTEEISVTAIGNQIREFRNALVNFDQLDLRNLNAEKEGAIQDIQNQAFNAMKNIESLLNVCLEGRYLFSGGNPVTPAWLRHSPKAF